MTRDFSNCGIRHVPSYLGIIMLFIGASVSEAVDPQPLGGPAEQQWTLAPAFSDEFNGSAVDASKWGTYYEWPAANRQVGGGNLILTITRDAEPPYAYDSGSVKSLGTSHYGYYEARMKSANVAADNAFWLAASTVVQEIDIVEQYGTWNPDRAYLTAWYDDGTLQGNGSWYESPVNLTEDYHVYGLDWNADTIGWYVDGVERRRIQNTHWHTYGAYIGLSLIEMDWLGAPEPVPATMYVDYIRIWQAVPEPATMALLLFGGVAMLRRPSNRELGGAC